MSHFTPMKTRLLMQSHPVSVLEDLGYTPRVGRMNIYGPHRVCCSAMRRRCGIAKKIPPKGPCAVQLPRHQRRPTSVAPCQKETGPAL